MRVSIRLSLCLVAMALAFGCGAKDARGERSEGSAAPGGDCIDYSQGSYSAMSCVGKSAGQSCSIGGDRVCVIVNDGPVGTAICGCQVVRPGAEPRKGACPPDTSLGCDCGNNVVGMTSCDDEGQPGDCLCPESE
ncbi:MAG: hypothetical protein R3F39_23460 [Myxococcota bacterium]